MPTLSSPVFPKPIQKAAETLSQKLEDKKYRIKFHDFQKELIDAGGFELLKEKREADLQEKMLKAANEQKKRLEL